MTALLLTPTVLSLVLIAAHFLRAGQTMLVALSLLLLGLVFVPRRWAAYALQAALILAAGEWVRTTLAIVAIRQQLGLASERLVVILGAVAVAALIAALLLRTPRLLRRFRLPG